MNYPKCFPSFQVEFRIQPFFDSYPFTDSGKVLGVDCHQTKYVKGVLKGRGVAKMKLTCDSKGNFLNQKGELTDVHQLSCTKKFEPVILLSKSRCAPLGADGRNVENQADHGLLSVQIGWNITNSKFQSQVLSTMKQSYLAIQLLSYFMSYHWDMEMDFDVEW